MLSEHDLKKLVAFQPHAPVLSVYLNTDTSSDSAEAYKLRLRQMLTPFEDEAPDDVRTILGHIEHAYDWAGQSIAIFSCEPAGFFEAYPLSLSLRERARLLPRPYVKPIADLFDQHGHYGIALVSQQNIRLLVYHLGAIQKEDKASGESIRRLKIGGGSQVSGRRGGDAGTTRSQEAISDRNIKSLAAKAAKFFKENNIRRILIGGTEETTVRLIDQLPKRWRSLVMGTFPINIHADHAEIRKRAHAAGQQAQAEQERKLIDSVITGAAKGREGVIRLDDTLSAVRNGSIKTLVIKEGFHAPGYRCSGCDYLTSQALTACPFCGESFVEIKDAIEMAVRQVITDGGEVAVIHDSLALDEAGKIGALLRY